MLGTKVGGHYEIKRSLGAGGFGKTYLATDLHRFGEELCVIKQLHPNITDPATLAIARRLFESEAKILQKLGNHPQIPSLLAYFTEETQGSDNREGQASSEFYLVQEYIDGHDLSHEIGNGKILSETQVKQILWDILEILSFIHDNNVIHRDIKPSNIMRRDRDRRLALIDFGAVKQISTQMMSPTGLSARTIATGTPGYAPPEVLEGQPHFCSDIYSVGMLAIEALTGIYPANLPYDSQTGEWVWYKSLADHNRVHGSPELVTIINKMTRRNFVHRYQSAMDVMRDLDPLLATPGTGF